MFIPVWRVYWRAILIQWAVVDASTHPGNGIISYRFPFEASPLLSLSLSLSLSIVSLVRKSLAIDSFHRSGFARESCIVAVIIRDYRLTKLRGNFVRWLHLIRLGLLGILLLEKFGCFWFIAACAGMTCHARREFFVRKL